MTLRLILTRHAKSDWGDPALGDHERPLNKRGQKSASAIGRWLAERGYLPDLVLTSTSTRTLETLRRMRAEWPAEPQVRELRALYMGAPQDMLDILRKVGAGATVQIIAHNPGCAVMAGMLAAKSPDDPDFHRYPTAFTAVFEFDAQNWADVDWGQGRVMAAMAPRRL